VPSDLVADRLGEIGLVLDDQHAHQVVVGGPVYRERM